MTTLEWNIYNYLKERSSQGLWTKQEDVQNYIAYTLNKTYLNKRTIRRYIQNIRNTDTIQKIIVTDYKKGYKLMSAEDEAIYLKKRRISLLKSLKQYYKDAERYAHNNQCKLTFDTKERDYIESLCKEEK